MTPPRRQRLIPRIVRTREAHKLHPSEQDPRNEAQGAQHRQNDNLDHRRRCKAAEWGNSRNLRRRDEKKKNGNHPTNVGDAGYRSCRNERMLEVTSPLCPTNI
jgi:hypothetical protein